jgi:hypothetical protein
MNPEESAYGNASAVKPVGLDLTNNVRAGVWFTGLRRGAERNTLSRQVPEEGGGMLGWENGLGSLPAKGQCS